MICPECGAEVSDDGPCHACIAAEVRSPPPKKAPARGDLALMRSDLPTVHPKGHPRAGKKVRTYSGLVLDEPGPVPVYRIVTKWYQEDPDRALQAAKKASKPQ